MPPPKHEYNPMRREERVVKITNSQRGVNTASERQQEVEQQGGAMTSRTSSLMAVCVEPLETNIRWQAETLKKQRSARRCSRAMTSRASLAVCVNP